MRDDIDKIEQGIIAAYLEKEDLFEKVQHLVSDKIFSNKVNAVSYKLIQAMWAKGYRPDFNILVRELKKLGAKPENIPIYHDGSKYILNIQNYVYTLFEFNRIRKELMPPVLGAADCFTKDTGSPMDKMFELKEAINSIELVLNNVSDEKTIKDVVDVAIQEIEESRSVDNKKSAPSTTINKLDEITGGLLPGVIVIGALPGMGKTSFLVNIIVQNGIIKNIPIVFFSLEMAATQIVKNVFSNMLDINTMAVRDGGVDDEQMIAIKQSRTRFRDNVIIDDTAGVTWQYIDAKLTKIRKRVPISQQMIVMVDYIQLMGNTEDETRGKTDEAKMAARCKGLMNIWKKHNVCIMELSQLGRDVANEKRRPRMSDLKESGAIEANANGVWLLHCPDYFEENPTDDQGRSLKGLVEIIVDKNRSGRKGYAYAKFIKKYSKFMDFNKDNPEHWESGTGIIA